MTLELANKSETYSLNVILSSHFILFLNLPAPPTNEFNKAHGG